ncbi:hypothetical protein [Pedobacter caeni]|uniref:Uncharacterized protein n=1 Tax=Pedobacter caeni TaxID=288992 RepID=A0A1M5ABS2_9SPHI|nr:hypothetical protein [Pedobacter caeni]SHF27771.1 hypothetical protein SAMN04488522_102679 [Pedobacter caeni]
MTDTIKHIDKLKGLEPKDLAKLETGAKLYLRHSNISFHVVSSDANGLMIRTTQGKHLSGNYADEVKLIELTRDLFGVLPGKPVIAVQPLIYTPVLVDIVDAKWIKEKMAKHRIQIEDIVADTGIEKTSLSAWINGTRLMTQPVKAMFYFIFTDRESKGK